MKVISLGLGVQSTTMYLMSSLGELDRADHAVFADPGAEHPETYKLLEYVLHWQQENDGVPIHVVRKSLLNDVLNQSNSTGQKMVAIPAYVKHPSGKDGLLRRQCTNEYKIKPVMKKIRELYGLKPRQRLPQAELWLGISTDEAHRMKDNQIKAMTNYYPLVEKQFNRNDCRKWLRINGVRIPVKSACVFCPYSSNTMWRNLKEQHPNSFSIAVDVDKKIRTSLEVRKNPNPVFLHRSLKPLEEAYLDEDQQDLFGEECEGYCGL